MSDNLTFAELEAQHVELLPARTVLSLFIGRPPGRGADGTGTNGSNPTNIQIGNQYSWFSQHSTSSLGVGGKGGRGG